MMKPGLKILINSEIDPLRTLLLILVKIARVLDTVFPCFFHVAPTNANSLAEQMEARPRLCNTDIIQANHVFPPINSVLHHEPSSQDCLAEDLP
jgi:hypothetical protein